MLDQLLLSCVIFAAEAALVERFRVDFAKMLLEVSCLGECRTAAFTGVATPLVKALVAF